MDDRQGTLKMESCIPWDVDGLDIDDVRQEQKLMSEYALATDQDTDRYVLTGGVMYDVSDEDGGLSPILDWSSLPPADSELSVVLILKLDTRVPVKHYGV